MIFNCSEDDYVRVLLYSIKYRTKLNLKGVFWSWESCDILFLLTFEIALILIIIWASSWIRNLIITFLICTWLWTNVFLFNFFYLLITIPLFFPEMHALKMFEYKNRNLGGVGNFLFDSYWIIGIIYSTS